jgi:SH3 domain-containing protein
MAASQCPKCAHLFDVRDGFGELLPLSYCSTCESYYLESLGACRWCGTKPERAPITPYVWRGVGAAAMVLVLLVAWLTRESRPRAASRARTTAARAADSAKVSMAVVPESVARTTVSSEGAIDRDTLTPAPQPKSIMTAPVVRQSAPQSDATPVAEQFVARPPTTSASSPRAVANSPAIPTAAPVVVKSRTPARWVSSTSTGWVIVRSDASKSARIVASIGPGSRVQLGESRGTWRRIRARGVSGWVEPRSLFVASRSAGKPGGLAAR